MIKFVDLKRQYDEIAGDLDAAIHDIIASSAFIQGTYVSRFENEFARYVDAKHCIGVGNGTDALYVALRTLGIGIGDEVITSAHTFIATAEAIVNTGAVVRFVDIEEKTYAIDVAKIEQCINDRTKAIIPVHLYGGPCDMDAIMGMANEHGIHVIEDCAQSHGAKYKGRNAGTFGVSACFSFFPGKNLGAYGDAGAIVTDDDTYAFNMRRFANHGRVKKYEHDIVGINSRLDGMQAAILSVKLRHLDSWNARRKEIASIYYERLSGDVMCPDANVGIDHVYHLYVVRVRNRRRVMSYLNENGIETGIHYPLPLPFQPAFKTGMSNESDYPVSWKIKDEILSLPIHGSMTEDEAHRVCDVLQKAVRLKA